MGGPCCSWYQGEDGRKDGAARSSESRDGVMVGISWGYHVGPAIAGDHSRRKRRD